MKAKLLWMCTALSLSILSLLGCSGASSPLTPVAVSLDRQVAAGSHYPWGLWQFRADPLAGKLEAAPLRTGNFHANVLPFLEPPAGLRLAISNVVFDNLVCDVDVSLRHPFPGLSMYTGFDVTGILISNGNKTGFSDPDIIMAGPGDTRLLNPDGYTRWWNPVEFQGNVKIWAYNDGLLGTKNSIAHFNSIINGYKMFGDDLDSDDDVTVLGPTNPVQFSQGYQNIRHYTIDFAAGLVFNYAVDANWEPPEGDAPYGPEDFPSSAWRPEAWAVSITEVKNSLYNENGDNGGELSLLIDVWDHFNAGLNKVRVESPGNFYPVESAVPIGGGPGYSTYQVEISNATPAPQNIGLLITVECEQKGYQDLVPDKTVSAYFGRIVAVSDHVPVYQDPVAIAAADPLTQDLDQPIHFYDNGSYDPDGGPIQLYEWDWNNDGIFEEQGSDVSHSWSISGIYQVQFRVTDDEGATDTLDQPLEIEINPQGPGKIAWVCRRDGNPEIYRMQGDGANVLRLTTYYDHDWEPAWSPDGTQIAWRRGGYGAANIWIMNEDGTDQHQVTYDGWNFDPDWTPDGEWIYYWSYNGTGPGSQRLWKVKPDGTGQAQVTFINVTSTLAPSVSPQGDKVAFRNSSGNDIWLVDTEGNNPLQLTFTPSVWEDNPSWSSDGSKICFTANNTGQYGIYSMNPDGSNVTPLTSPGPGENDYGAVYGVDDEELIVWRRLGPSETYDDIGRYTIATGDFVNLTNDMYSDEYPDWHPND